jgi:uncharacterized SAM-binding protein YcdF (DUF218 family)
MKMGFGRLWRIARLALALTGGSVLLFLAWISLGLPLVIDRWLDVSQPPAPAGAIVCIAGGTSLPNLPTEEGWSRIYSAVQLFADGYAPVVVFTGRGWSGLSEAETYAQAAEWLGLPHEAILLDPHGTATNEHPLTIGAATHGRVSRETRLLLVTSRLHSRRVLMTFRRQGFSQATVVSDYRATHASGRLAWGSKTTTFVTIPPSRKEYGGVVARVGNGIDRALVVIRESAAILWYRWKGYA